MRTLIILLFVIVFGIAAIFLCDWSWPEPAKAEPCEVIYPTDPSDHGLMPDVTDLYDLGQQPDPCEEYFEFAGMNVYWDKGEK